MAPWSTSFDVAKATVPVATLIIAAGCSVGAINSSAPRSPGSSSAAVGAAKTVPLSAVGDSGVFGTATLSDVGGGQTQVVIGVEANSNPDMPGAVSLGTCTRIDESTIFHLNDTRHGLSTSIIPISLSALTARPFIVHIHTAPDEPSLAACGEIT